METEETEFNDKNRLQPYYKYNSCLNNSELENILLIDSLYKEIPNDISPFRDIYVHLDPNILKNGHEGIIFLKIAKSKKSSIELKDELNSYINIKFNDIENYKPYLYNMVIFEKYAFFASQTIEEILGTSLFPKKLLSILKEKEEVKNCNDLCQMLEIYKSTSSNRIKFEILRKLNIIVLIARINKSINVNYLDNKIKKVIKTFTRGLGLNKSEKKPCYLWLDHQNKIDFEKDKTKAELKYNEEIKKREKLSLSKLPLQTSIHHSFKTNNGHKIINLEYRNKFEKNGRISYASFIEKMFRKNLEFPNQIHDVIGLKMVVEKESDIYKIIADLENFLGGNSTRNREKNTYHRFNRRLLNKHSSINYYVWKAIYDVTLAHPSVDYIKRIINITKNNEAAQRDLKENLQNLIANPQDTIVEVQLQDINTYLLSIAKGSPTSHGLLKMRQIRSNSFCKIFPQEIYEKDVLDLKYKILNKKLD